MPTIDPIFFNPFRGATHVPPLYENPNNGGTSYGGGGTSLEPTDTGSSPQITYTEGTTYPVGDARNYLPELTHLGTADTSANFGQMSDAGNGVPYFANPPSLPSVIGAVSGGVTESQIGSTLLRGEVANEYAAAVDPNPTGLINEINNANGLNHPLGSQVDFAAVNPNSGGGDTPTTTSSGPNLLLIVGLLGAAALVYYLWKTHKL